MVPDNLKVLQDIVKKIYIHSFDESLVDMIFDAMGRLLDAQYFCLGLFTDKVDVCPFNMKTNRSQKFLDAYVNVADKDFLMNSIASNGKEYIMSRAGEYNDQSNMEFTYTVQKADPLSDVFYSPIRINGIVCGYWGAGVVSGKGPYAPFTKYIDLPITDKQLSLFHFLKGFLDDALERSFIPLEIEDDMAFMDYAGNILLAGDRIKDVFSSVFGKNRILNIRELQADSRLLFLNAFKRFRDGPVYPGFDRFSLRGKDGLHYFLFRPLKRNSLNIQYSGVPSATVSLIDTQLESFPRLLFDDKNLADRFLLTPRECEVVQGILAGKSNKEIAFDLRIEESTVKRHSHNIYEKTGFKSRVELVTGLFRQV